MRYAMAIDLDGCIGCQMCSIACKSNNNLPNDVLYNRVITDGGTYMDTARGEYPNNLYKIHVPVTCQHCANPECAKVCPTGATYKREDGIVTVNHDRCIGCRACMMACPYGVRSYLDREPEYLVDFPLGDADAPAQITHTVVKCTFCEHRLAKGQKPACMEFCLGRARYWGDVDDPNSDISRFLAGKTAMRLKEELGLEPACYYVSGN